MVKPIRLGQIVISRQGRDAGQFFMVVGINAEGVQVADGVTRRVRKPKRKNPRHLSFCLQVAEEIEQKLRNKQTVTDEEISCFLRSMGIVPGRAVRQQEGIQSVREP